MKPCLIVRNPAAGRGRALRQWDGIERKLRDTGIDFEEAVTSRPCEAGEIAQRESGNYECIVAAGGDGTVHEVVNGLMRAGGRAALGVIPLGSGDDFAKLLSNGFIFDFSNKKTKTFDVGRISTGSEVRYFANGMDIGFGAHGARNVKRVPRFLTGFGAYLGALLLTMVRYPLLRVRLQLDDAPPFEFTTAMTAAMNGTTFGGSFRVCPEARPDDGLLDLLLVDAVGRLQILQLVPKILRGAHAGDPHLRLVRAKRVTIESDEPLLVEADGEIAFQDARELRIEVLPAALRVFA
ncbi:MAG TPA: diacylglycerol kinase family protein [Burkholderiales bacterium]|nr:diacylglycerol kinase family protein [Burkholderiales bacterium]